MHKATPLPLISERTFPLLGTLVFGANGIFRPLRHFWPPRRVRGPASVSVDRPTWPDFETGATSFVRVTVMTMRLPR